MSEGLFDRRDEPEELSLLWLSWLRTYLHFIICKQHPTLQKGWRGAGKELPHPDTLTSSTCRCRGDSGMWTSGGGVLETRQLSPGGLRGDLVPLILLLQDLPFSKM